MKRLIVFGFIQFILINLLSAQEKTVSDTTFKPSGKLWGYTFGDLYYKAHADALNRGGGNQYTGIEEGRNAFQIRRAYLGYNYDISPKFAAELLLAAEDNVTTSTGATSGDLLSDNKLSFYIKLANLRWKNLWKGTDLVVGQVSTPAFALLSEPIWGYRSIERTITDIRRTPSFDLGAALQGKFDPSKGNYGYDLMVGNGNSAKPENDKFKWFYGDVWAKLLNQKLVLQLYSDYERLNWWPGFHHSRNMIKGFAAYTTPAFTIGVEAFVNNLKGDLVGLGATKPDTLANTTTAAQGISTFVRGQVIPNKLGYFARFDAYNPNTDYNETAYPNYKALTGNYEPNNKEQFITAGVDYTPVKNVHLMPNFWYNKYINQRSSATGTTAKDYDLVYRITFYYVYGK